MTNQDPLKSFIKSMEEILELIKEEESKKNIPKDLLKKLERIEKDVEKLSYVNEVLFSNMGITELDYRKTEGMTAEGKALFERTSEIKNDFQKIQSEMHVRAKKAKAFKLSKKKKGSERKKRFRNVEKGKWKLL